VVFDEDGRTLASAYAEIDYASPAPGLAQIDSPMLWRRIRETIAEAAAGARQDPVAALAVCSLGEAMVPVSRDRRILGPSLLGFDPRGQEYMDKVAVLGDRDRLYRINGNAPGNNYGLTKLLWVREHEPRLYESADRFLLWGSLVAWMLGAEPRVDYSLANRTLLFDLARRDWSDELLAETGIQREKLAPTAAAGSVAGEVSAAAAAEVGLAPGTPIVVGAHDQCANSLGSGVIEPGQAMFGMGTYPCIVPVFARRQAPGAMMERGLNTEHHAVPDRYVTFIYNQGGSIIKWYRDTFAGAEKREGGDLYARLEAELGDRPSPVMVLPHFSVMGPPEFVADSCGVVLGLQLDSTRADIHKGILEGITFALRECVDTLPGTEIAIEDFRAVGGGSRSDAWLRVTADVMGRPVRRLAVAEAGALGAALLAGAGIGAFTLVDGVAAMVRQGELFEPRPAHRALYDERFTTFQRLWPALRDMVRGLRSQNDSLRLRRSR
jgi:xylulokinase